MKIAVVGLGYVGLPLAVEFGGKFPTIGFDLSTEKIIAYRNHIDPTGEVNVAVGDRTTLNQLYEQVHLNLLHSYPYLQGVQPVYRDFRAGDTCTTRWPTSARPLRCWATSQHTALVKG